MKENRCRKLRAMEWISIANIPFVATDQLLAIIELSFSIFDFLQGDKGDANLRQQKIKSKRKTTKKTYDNHCQPKNDFEQTKNTKKVAEDDSILYRVWQRKWIVASYPI